MRSIPAKSSTWIIGLYSDHIYTCRPFNKLEVQWPFECAELVAGINDLRKTILLKRDRNRHGRGDGIREADQ